MSDDDWEFKVKKKPVKATNNVLEFPAKKNKTPSQEETQKINLDFDSVPERKSRREMAHEEYTLESIKNPKQFSFLKKLASILLLLAVLLFIFVFIKHSK